MCWMFVRIAWGESKNILNIYFLKYGIQCSCIMSALMLSLERRCVPVKLPLKRMSLYRLSVEMGLTVFNKSVWYNGNIV